MTERILFLNDHWLETLCTPSTDVQQNYFPLVDNSELAASLNDFSACLNGSVVEPTVEFDGWEAVIIPTIDSQDWLWMLYHDDIGYMAFAGFSGAEHAIQSDDDGKTWTTLPTPLAGNFWWQPIYVPSKNLIIVPTDDGEGTNFLTSGDGGAVWVPRTTGLGVITMKGIAYSPELDQFVAWSWNDIPISSTDLITWTQGTITGEPFDYYDTTEAVVWAPHLMLWCGINFWGQVITSTDGLVWDLNVLENNTWDSGFFYMAWSEHLRLFVAQGEHHQNFTQPNMFITSPDAVDWTQRPLTDSGIVLVQHAASGVTFLPAVQVIWSDSTFKFYALTKTGILPGSAVTPPIFLMTSTDGFIWTVDTTIPSTHDLDYPVLGTQPYIGIAVKDENSMVLLSRAMIIRKIP